MATIRQLDVFAEVVGNAGSVTQAAARLYVSQPSVSDTMRALESSVGAKMFSGRGRARALTPAGEIYWGYTRRILGLIDEAAQAVADSGHTPRGHLSIVAVPTAGEYLVAGILHAFVRPIPRWRYRSRLRIAPMPRNACVPAVLIWPSWGDLPPG